MRCNFIRDSDPSDGLVGYQSWLDGAGSGVVECNVPLQGPKSSYRLVVRDSNDHGAPMQLSLRKKKAEEAPPQVVEKIVEEVPAPSEEKKPSWMARFGAWAKRRLLYAAFLLWAVAVAALIYVIE